MGAKFIIVACLLYANFVCSAQKAQTRDSILNTERFVPQALTTNEYINYQLPPLDSLFEGAQRNPRLKAIGASIEAARNDLKSTQRDWLQYFSVRAGYTYGILGTYTDQETQYVPLTTVYSGSTQNSWSIGANINIPFNRLFSHRATVKKQKEIVRSAEYTRQVEFDEMNREFIEKFGVDWMDVLPQWYENRKIPVFFVRDFKVENITFQENEGDGLSAPMFSEYPANQDWNDMRYRVSASVFNDSDVDGVVSFEAREMYLGGVNARRQDSGDERASARNFLIKAGTGKQIAVVMQGMSITFNTNISNNLPVSFYAMGMMSKSKTTDTTEFVKDLDRSYFMPATGEMIVDNEDENFKLISPSSRKRLKNLISPLKELKYEMGTNLIIRDGVEIVPKHMINFEAYGLNKLTHAFMLQGSKVTMEWTVRIEREGEYEILAYIPPKVLAHRIEERERGGRGSGYISVSYSAVSKTESEEIKQHYIVNFGGEKQEVSADIKEQMGWVSLGLFRLPVGECKIVLTDQGDKNQVLLGDAIKWVYREDK